MSVPPRSSLSDRCARLAGWSWFQSTVVAVIVLNALVIGLETYDEAEQEVGGLLDWLDRIFLAVFVVEIAVRLGAYGRQPWRFFRSGWNAFDFAIVAVAFVPGVQGHSTLLRLARLLRVTRLFRLLPEVHVLLRGVMRSLQPIAGLVVLTLLLLYVYAIVGWSLFGESDPERWGDLGEAMLTLFAVLTLEGWIDIFASMRETSLWAFPYMLSFIFIGTFVVLNLVIGIVLNSMEEARAAHRLEREDANADLLRTIADLRDQLEDLERKLDGRARPPG